MRENPSATDRAPAPLRGRRVVVTRSPQQAGPLLARLEELGATPLLCPAIAVAPPASYEPLDAALRRLREYDWALFASANAVRAVSARLSELGIAPAPEPPPRIGAVGPATAEALAAGLRQPDLVAPVHTAEGLLAALPEAMAARRCLIPCADIARDTLAAGLRARGAEVDAVTAYRTVPAPELGRLAETMRAGGVDAILFASPSSVQHFVEGLAAGGLRLDELLAADPRPAVVCIGPVTAATARASGLPVDATGRDHSAEGLLEALIEWFGNHDARH